MVPTRTIFMALLAFAVFFAAVFVQFPLAGSLPGYADVVLYLGLFNDYANHVQSWFTGEAIGHCLYPAGPPYGYLEPSFGAGAIFVLFKWLGANDLWAYYWFTVTTFTLNATAAFALAKQYLRFSAPALFVALAFSVSSFALGNLENQNTLTYFFAIACIYFFREYLLQQSTRSLVLAMVSGGLQIYFGTYTFIFQSIVLLVLGLLHYRRVFFANGWLTIAKALPIYLLLVLPYIKIYLLNPELAGFYNPSRDDPSSVEALSLNLRDLYRVLPNNLLYPIQQDLPQIFLYNLRSASMGLVFYVLVLVGFFARPKFGREAGILATVCFIVALGPSVTVAGKTIPMPLGWLYEHTDMDAYLRHSARMFFLVSLFLALLAGQGIWVLAQRLRVSAMAVALLASMGFVVENVPFPFEKYPSKEYMVSGLLYPEIPRADKPKVLLELPSSLHFDTDDFAKPLNQFAREYLYMYCQSKHKQHSLNGGVAFFPPQRLQNAVLTGLLPNEKALSALIADNKLDYIIYHPRLLLAHEESLLPMLVEHPQLQVLAHTTNYIIFEVKQ